MDNVTAVLDFPASSGRATVVLTSGELTFAVHRIGAAFQRHLRQMAGIAR